MRILHISDCHIGLQYAAVRSAKARSSMVNARISALGNAVDAANRERCDAIVVAGDLFENHRVSQRLINQVCDILGGFERGMVYILPGNHDYYREKDDSALWDYFMRTAGDNIYLFTDNKPLKADIADDAVCFFPCICHDRHSSENALGNLRNIRVNPSVINIGIAHGSLKGLSYDREGCYYNMSREELSAIPMDLWLLGHAHIPEPQMEPGVNVTQANIYNAGTHQQTNIHNNTEGSVFVIDIDSKKHISAHRVITGVIKFSEQSLQLTTGDCVADVVRAFIASIDAKHTVLRLHISGTVNSDEYKQLGLIEDMVSESVLYLDKLHMDVNEEITGKMIDSQTVVGSVENTLLKSYLNEPDLLAALYELVMSCKEY